MLPSTGYFKTIVCPFYENGSCDRPYCHFKHSRREDASNTSTNSADSTQVLEKTSKVGTSSIMAPNSDTLQQLVSETVKKFLAEQINKEKLSENIVSKVVEELKPTLAESLQSVSAVSLDEHVGNLNNESISNDVITPLPISNPTSCTYNPTPIAELKKRHIPIALYNPTRETKVTVKRKCSPERTKSWHSLLFKSNSIDESDLTYKPSSISGSSDVNFHSYVPTVKSGSSISPSTYDDSISNDYVPKMKEAYYPKVKKRREEYVPRKIKTPFNSVDTGVNHVSDYDIMDEVLCMNSNNQDSSQDYFDLEPTFSDDDDVEQDKGKQPENNEEKKEKKEPDEKEQKDDVEIKEICDSTQSHQQKTEVKSDVPTQEKENQDIGVCNINTDNNMWERNKSSETIDKNVKPKDIQSSNKGKKSKHLENEKKSVSRREKDNSSQSEDGGKELKENNDVKKSSEKLKKDRKEDKHDSRHRHNSKNSSKSKTSSKHSSSSSSKDKHSNKKDNNCSKRDSHKTKKSEKDRNHNSNEHKHRTKTASSSTPSKVDKHKEKRSDKSSESHSKSKSKSSKKSGTSSSKQGENDKKSSSHKKDKINSSDDSSILDNILTSKDYLFDASDSDHDVEEECLKIFQEFEESDHPKPVTKKGNPLKRESEEKEEVGKKRVAHPSAETNSIRKPGPSQPVKRQPNPQQRLYERWRLMKQAAAEKTAQKSVAVAKSEVQITAMSSSTEKLQENFKVQSPSGNPGYTTSVNENLNGNGKVRIAHVPYAMSLALAKRPVIESKSKETDTKTIAQTSKKARIAHIPPTVPQLLRPEPLEASTQKFPLNVRQCYVNMMHDICIQIYTDPDDAVQRALREEFACHDRCKALSVYKSSCMMAIHRLRKEVEQDKVDMSGRSACGMVSHEAVLAGKSKGSWSVIKPKKAATSFKGPTLYNMLTKWILAEQQLKDNGYPRPHPDGQKGRAKVYTLDTRNHSVLSKVQNERTCGRCGQTYMVDKRGFAIRKENCIYHWGRKFTIRGEGRYSCCQQYGSAAGCSDAKTHVWDYVDYENLRGYVKTLPKDVPDEEQGVYSLDCEMCYTTQGLELTRITVINEDCDVIYETLVKPENPIIDYNTRFSGITEESMKDVTTTILEVQATLLTLFSSKTILVGHSLESDFKALKLIHDTVVDTSVMFPHKHGYPHKRALKNLCSEYLRKLIQNDLGGHDSHEDAIACMELVLWKVKEEAKLQ